MAINQYKKAYLEYENMLKQNIQNSTNALNIAKNDANKNLNAYLQAIGLQGSGVGSSKLVDIQTNYTNNLNSLNQNYENNISTARQNYSQQAQDSLSNMVSGMNFRQAYDYINRARGENQGVLDSSVFANLESQQNASLMENANALRDAMLEGYNNEIKNGTPTSAHEYQVLYNDLEKAISSGDTNSILNAVDYTNKKINSGSSQFNSDGTIKSVISDGQIHQIQQEVKQAGSKKYSQQIQDFVYNINRGNINLENGSIVDFNKGAGKNYYIYDKNSSSFTKLERYGTGTYMTDYNGSKILYVKSGKTFRPFEKINAQGVRVELTQDEKNKLGFNNAKSITDPYKILENLNK